MMWGQTNWTINCRRFEGGFYFKSVCFSNPFWFAFGRDFLLRTQKNKRKKKDLWKVCNRKLRDENNDSRHPIIIIVVDIKKLTPPQSNGWVKEGYYALPPILDLYIYAWYKIYIHREIESERERGYLGGEG